MSQTPNGSDFINLDELEKTLFSRLKNVYLENDDEPYFMINYNPQPNGKCFLSTEDINNHVQNGCLIFPKTFCKKLYDFAKPIQNDQKHIISIVNQFADKLKSQIMASTDKFIEKITKELIPNEEPYIFFKKFSEGNYKDDKRLLYALEDIVRKWEDYEKNIKANSVHYIFGYIQKQFEGGIGKTEKILDEIVTELDTKKFILQKELQLKNQTKNDSVFASQMHTTMVPKENSENNLAKLYSSQMPLDKTADRNKNFLIPRTIDSIDHNPVITGKHIPCGNGIDLHPIKNKYITMGCDGGELIIANQDTNRAIKKIYLENNLGGYSQNCLWSPSGEKIMVSTREPQSIYIFDESGEKLLKSIPKTSSKEGYGAIWLSEKEVAVGYSDGVVRFFNIDLEKEIGNVKLNGYCPWGMDCLDESHLIVGDKSGSVSNINWKTTKVEWVMPSYHAANNHISCLKLSRTKVFLLTGSNDGYVKLTRIKTQLKLWDFQMNGLVLGLSWLSGEIYIIALSYHSQLVLLNANDGTILIDYKKLTQSPVSLRVNPISKEIFVGDSKGGIRKLKISQA